MAEGINEDRTENALETLNNPRLVEKMKSVGITEDEIKRLIDIRDLTFAKKKRPTIFLRIDGGKHKLVSITDTHVGVRKKGADESNRSRMPLLKISHDSFIDAEIEKLDEKHYREDD